MKEDDKELAVKIVQVIMSLLLKCFLFLFPLAAKLSTLVWFLYTGYVWDGMG